MNDKKGHGHFGVRLIAFGKLFQLVAVLGVGVGALLFKDLIPPESVQQWVNAFAPQSDWLRSLVDKLGSASDKKLAQFGAGGLVYAALFAVEGIGLWRQKTWAEYLTVIVTSSFIPFEIYGLTQEFSVAKVITLIINSAVVIHLTVRIILDRREKRAHERPQAGARS